jgi:RHS repeat-associated protein
LGRILAKVSATETGTRYSPASQIVSEAKSNDAYASSTAANVARPYSVNGLNQYATVGPNGYTYDRNGNLTSDGVNSYVYDAENRLVSRTTGGAAAVSLAYDPNGRLWQVSSAAGTTRFLYEGDRLTSEYDGAGNLLRSYFHGPGPDEPLVWYELAGTYSRRFLHADHQGSIVAVSDASGNKIAINAYDAWGVPNAGNVGRFGYTGQVWLPELGMWYYKARIYSPMLGRFLQTDPIGYKDQVNLYAYVGNDPMDRRDPTGTTIMLSGSEEARHRFIDTAYRLTGVHLRQDSHGNLVQVGSRNTHIGNATTASRLIGGIQSRATFSINAVMRDQRVMVDSFTTNKVDVADLNAVAGRNTRIASALLDHVLTERQYNAEHHSGFDRAHVVGAAEEARVMGAVGTLHTFTRERASFNYIYKDNIVGLDFQPNIIGYPQ